jgi:predicted TIM-barrel fold metal-dependent hydrolase
VLVHSLNQWLHETWSFNYKDRIFTTPVISLPIVDKAIEELEWCLERGAKVILIRPAPVPGYRGSRSFAFEEFDPFWKRAVESGVLITMHASDSGYARYQADWTGPQEMLPFKDDAFRMATATKRPIEDSMASAICHGLFARHPKLKLAVIENGGSWVPHLLENLAETYKKMPQAFAEDPVKTFRRQVVVSPFFEDHMAELVEAMGGTDNIIFGSDFPHPEGLAQPATYTEHLPKSLTPDDVRKIMGGNLGKLMGYEQMV